MYSFENIEESVHRSDGITWDDGINGYDSLFSFCWSWNSVIPLNFYYAGIGIITFQQFPIFKISPS